MLGLIDGPHTHTEAERLRRRRDVDDHVEVDDGQVVDDREISDRLDRVDLASVAGGDPAALERLYGRHGAAMFGFIRRYLNDRQLAEEALQDTMVTVWQQAGSFRGDSTVRTWMFGVARFKALGIARRRAPEPVDPTTPAVRLAVADLTAGPERTVVARDRMDRVARALDALPDAQRECFLLAVSGRLGYDEIAEMMGIEPGTVKSRVARARRALAPLREDHDRTGGASR